MRTHGFGFSELRFFSCPCVCGAATCLVAQCRLSLIPLGNKCPETDLVLARCRDNARLRSSWRHRSRPARLFVPWP
jgi:hypothetical protein